ncbi:ATP-binding cassette domain-containing protein [Mammaliicoccus sciuri]|uniref:ATP-binding cassette domain-containing protein n=1 Tax=Mammaliicoccus sciuri TaxID=1296 RepID=UPI0034DD0ABC
MVLEPLSIKYLIFNIEKSKENLKYSLLILILILLLKQVSSTVELYFRTRIQDTLPIYFETIIFNACDKLSFEQLESSEVQDSFHSLKGKNIFKIFMNIMNIFSNIIVLIPCMILFIFYGDIYLLILLIVILFLEVLFYFKEGTRKYSIEKEVLKNTRYADTLFNFSTNVYPNMEIRLLNASGYFKEKFNHIYLDNFRQIDKDYKKYAWRNIIIVFFTESLKIWLLGLLTYYLVSNKTEINEFILLLTIFFIINRITREFIVNVRVLFSNQLFFNNLSELLNFENKVLSEKDFSNDNAIIIENLYFKYLGTSKYVLENINMKIDRGSTIAIVGDNGSGKTTLSKLILGLYTPVTGRVTTGNISKTVMFQDFCRYKLKVSENIFISDFNKSFNEDSLNRIPIHLPTHLQYEDLLGKEIGGKEISGGEWQKLALLRALWRKNELTILDEPTSAIES